MDRLIDVNHNLFARGNDFIDFLDVDEAVAIALQPPPAHSDLPAGLRATVQLVPPTYFSLCNGIADDRAVNDALLGAAARLAGHAAGVAEPKYGNAALAEIERIAALKAKAIVWSPRAQGVFANDRMMADLCMHAAGCGLVSMIHSEPYSVNESLARIWNLAGKCAGVPLVVLGACGSWENIQTINDNGGGPENLFYDLSGLCAAWDLTALVKFAGVRRLLFGSGGPRFLRGLLDVVEACSLDGADEDAILFGNAAALLGIADEGRS